MNTLLKHIFLVLFSTFVLVSNGQNRTVGLFQNDSSALNGYTLVYNIASTEAFLVDNCGEMVNSWVNSTYQPGPVMYFLNDGSLLRTGKITTGEFIAGGSGGIIERYDWNDNLIWSYQFDGPDYRSHHDIYPMDNGNILVLSWDKKSRLECVLAGLDTNHYDGDIWFEKVTEIQPLGIDSATTVWEWRLWDHLIQDFDSNRNNYGSIQLNRNKIDLNYSNNNGISADYFHANGIDYNKELDQIIISVRNYDEFWIIDHSTTTFQASQDTGGRAGMGGQILYRWGNPEAYQNGTIADKQLFGQHHPNWIQYGPDSGKIMVFNNGYLAPIQESKVQIINPPLDSNGTYQFNIPGAFGPVNVDWSYTLPVFVDFVSGAYRLENENTLITSGPDGHLYELDVNDSIVWEYVIPLAPNGQRIMQGAPPVSNTTFRSYKYPADWPIFSSLNPVPQMPLETNPLPSNCVLYPNSPVGLSSSGNLFQSQIHYYPNPVENELTIELKSYSEPIEGSVFSIHGRLIKNFRIVNERTYIDFSELNSGIYVIYLEANGWSERIKLIKQ